MRRDFAQYLRSRIAWGILVAQVFGLAATPAYAAKPSYSPDWAQSISRLAPNQSFLDHWGGTDEAAALEFLDAKTAAEMQLKYHDLSRQHRMRESYGISSPEDDRSFYGKAEEFSRHLFRMILNYQVQSRLKKAEKNSSEVRTFSRVQKATQKLQVQVDENIKLGTKTDIPGQKGRLWLTSPYVDGALDVDFGEAWEDPANVNLKTLDPGERNRDRYRLSLSRGLPIWDLRSGVSYGFESTLMTASLSKSLFQGLSCEFLTRRGFDSALSGLSTSEEAVKLLYKIQF